MTPAFAAQVCGHRPSGGVKIRRRGRLRRCAASPADASGGRPGVAPWVSGLVRQQRIDRWCLFARGGRGWTGGVCAEQSGEWRSGAKRRSRQGPWWQAIAATAAAPRMPVLSDKRSGAPRRLFDLSISGSRRCRVSVAGGGRGGEYPSPLPHRCLDWIPCRKYSVEHRFRAVEVDDGYNRSRLS